MSIKKDNMYSVMGNSTGAHASDLIIIRRGTKITVPFECLTSEGLIPKDIRQQMKRLTDDDAVTLHEKYGIDIVKLS